ncbi:MAG: Unknown protein [uncultured Thiotrichaceae bacterium]|uniref:Uncharacterized protein n=1 Tax=uncultured Thiotrichaceae bacterium TaxID=298394 RepID=A0A6S6SJW0_9GAMM|nr:MAG: Unknown protein [uncultured Thiotrichaceae bacterium]
MMRLKNKSALIAGAVRGIAKVGCLESKLVVSQIYNVDGRNWMN